MSNESSNNYKLGVFVILGIVLFVIAVYFIGVNRNLFGSNFVLRSEFKNVSGLKQGSNVRLSGINIGTVNKIEFISDSLVLVKLLIRKDVQQYIKTDAMASIGSDGLVGDKVLIISPGNSSSTAVKNNDIIVSFKTIEIEDILSSVKISADNTQLITNELIDFTHKMNDKNGLISKIMTNKDFASRIDNTIANLEISAKEIAQFAPTLNNHNGPVNNLFTNKEWSSNIEKSFYNLQNSLSEIDIFTAQLNNHNNALYALVSNESIAVALKKTITNLETSSNDLVQFTSKINNEENVLSKLTNNPKLGRAVDSTLINLEKSINELKEIEEAAKSNFLLKGYFNKKKNEENKKNN